MTLSLGLSDQVRDLPWEGPRVLLTLLEFPLELGTGEP